MSPRPPLAESKARLRREALARRDALDATAREDAALRIAERALAFAPLRGATTLGAYWPIRSEVDPRPLMRGLVARGQQVALSRIVHPLLSFRRWRPGDELAKGSFGVHEPHPDAPVAYPDALLVPLAAFDRRGGRIGYGKGHFDRAIAELETRHAVLVVGLAYSVQEIDEVPVEPHDCKLDAVVTEREVVLTAG
jgi:5-formyltetrahydrofolate cyclo-ligase